MESISPSPSSSSLHAHLHNRNLIFPYLPSPNPTIISFPYRLHPQRFRVSCTGHSGQQVEGIYGGADFLRKPVVEVKEEVVVDDDLKSESEDDVKKRKEEDGWIDWEDQILEDNVPLVGFVGGCRWCWDEEEVGGDLGGVYLSLILSLNVYLLVFNIKGYLSNFTST
ncbi:hypothetical protein Hanom_Chr07g00639441 [Helianthus anomalus]